MGYQLERNLLLWTRASLSADIPPVVIFWQASIFTHGIFRNPVTLYGVSVSVAVMVMIVYAPFLQVGIREHF